MTASLRSLRPRPPYGTELTVRISKDPFVHHHTGHESGVAYLLTKAGDMS